MAFRSPQQLDTAGYQRLLGPGVTGQNIPLAGLYLGLKRPRLDYTRVYYGLGQFISPQAKLYPHEINNDINNV